MTKWRYTEVSKSPTLLSKALNEHVFYEIQSAFFVPLFDRTSQTLWEAINLARIGHARALCEFFSTSSVDRDKKKFRSDDIISEDFGFDSSPVNDVNEDIKARFGKDLFHLTYSRLRHTPESKPWPTHVLSGVHEKSMEFVDHVLRNDLPAGITPDTDMWLQLETMLSSGHEVIYDAWFESRSPSELRFVGSFTYGEKLPNGLSVLTRCLART